METLNSSVNKMLLLDMLAFLLWHGSCGLGPFYIKFSKRLYKEVLADLKSQAACSLNTFQEPCDFDTLNMRCRDLSDLFFLEKRLQLIEEKLFGRE